MERYVSALASHQADQGMDVSVIGGDQSAMRAALGRSRVRLLPAASVREALGSLASIRRPDIINSHMSDADLAAIIYRGLRKTPRIVSTRHFGSRRGSSVPARLVFGLTAGRIAAQIAISEFVGGQVEGACVVVRTGVDDADGESPARRDRIVLMAQRLETEKSTELGIRAWAEASARTEGWRLVIAGDGSQRSNLEQLASRLGVADSVRFLGHRSDVGDLMNHSGILLAPTPKEGLGLSVLEGMARSLPIVASASGGHLETVGGVPDAALFAPGDASTAAEHIDRLAGDVAWRGEYGLRLRDRQRSEFAVGRQVERTTAVYEGVLGS